MLSNRGDAESQRFRRKHLNQQRTCFSRTSLRSLSRGQPSRLSGLFLLWYALELLRSIFPRRPLVIFGWKISISLP